MLKFLLGQTPAPDLATLRVLLDSAFRGTYLFWLAQSDPGHWFEGDGAIQEAATYRMLVEPLGHSSLHALMDRLDALNSGQMMGEPGNLAAYLDLPRPFPDRQRLPPRRRRIGEITRLCRARASREARLSFQRYQHPGPFRHTRLRLH